MPLEPGVRLGPYEIVSLLGAGGMGEVYRARDTKLNRDVALKILPDAFANDPDRLARFTREAQTLAALNHPHIAHIHGLEESPSSGSGQPGVRALVMELVDGEDLAQRLVHGAIPLDEALAIAKQIAAALEAAHEQGIVHRDLKPANIKIRADGTVKVLDFGLAKAVDPRHSPPAVLANSPTMPSPAMMTGVGMILGTAAYMAPEQARGKVVDKRADIWAFGCVLYEMLSGRAVYDGGTVSDVIARVLERDPEWTALPAATPPGVRRALQRCLEKDLTRRLRDIGDLELLLEAPAASTDKPTRSARGSWLAWSVAAVALLAAGLVSLRNVRETPDTSAPIRFQVDTGVKLAESQQFSISPDGRHLVFAGSGSDGVMRLWVRSFDSLETLPLSGTEADVGQRIPPMFWSPDSRFIAFDNRGQLKKIERSGGSPQTVCNLKGIGVGGTWNRDGVILVGNTDGGLVRCSAVGGAESIATALNSSRQEGAHLFPSFLPDGRHFLYMRVSRTSPQNTAIYVGSLDAKPDEQAASPLLTVGLGPAIYVPTADSRSGHVLFPRGQALLAVPFDPQKLVAAGDAFPVADAVGSYFDGASFSSSANGVLVYRAPDQDLQLTWVNRQGQPIERMGDPGRYTNVALSPDGTQAVVAREHPQNRVDRDLWLVDLQRGGSTRLTFNPGVDEYPVWYPDGSRIAFSRGQRLLQQPIDAAGAEQVLLQDDQTKRTTGVSPDGRFLLYLAESRDPAMKTDLWALPLTGDPKPLPVAVDQLEQLQGQFSPDGRWIAYVSNESGAYEVFVRPFSSDMSQGNSVTGRKVLVSRGGGGSPRWRRDGKELLYLATGGNVIAMDVDTKADFRAGSPRTLFRAANVLPEWGVSADGSRFLFAVPTGSSTPPPFNVVLNWQATLKR